jgi:hypothetical protein
MLSIVTLFIVMMSDAFLFVMLSVFMLRIVTILMVMLSVAFLFEYHYAKYCLIIYTYAECRT